jgi:hypothetical protein
MQVIDKHIDMILIKFRKSGGYSELPEESLRAVIRDHLLNEHDNDLEALSVQMEIEQSQGKIINSDFYKREYKKVKNRLNDRIHDLGYMGEDMPKLLP